MRAIDGLEEIADAFDAAVLDQWGVLHDGTAPYPQAGDALRALRRANKRVVVLSNSGKRADLNLARIAAMGLPTDGIEIVMTSGEALWRDLRDGRVEARRPFAVTGATADAARWAEGLDLALADRVEDADALLLMGLADGATLADHAALLERALERRLLVLCSNPDRESPRADGRTAVQPGTLAAEYERRGGTVRWYGKPHRPVFQAVETFTNVPPERHLMVGDSPEHDVAGAAASGWRTCFVRGGLHAAALRDGTDEAVRRVSREHGAPSPDAHMGHLAW